MSRLAARRVVRSCTQATSLLLCWDLMQSGLRSEAALRGCTHCLHSRTLVREENKTVNVTLPQTSPKAGPKYSAGQQPGWMLPLRARRAKLALGGMAEGSGAMAAAAAAAAASQNAACADADGLGVGASLGPRRSIRRTTSMPSRQAPSPPRPSSSSSCIRTHNRASSSKMTPPSMGAYDNPPLRAASFSMMLSAQLRHQSS